MDNTLLIIEENDKETKETEDDPSAKLKLAMANKKLKEQFFRDNEINKTTEIMNEEFENQIDDSIMKMEHSVDTYNTDSEDEASTPSNGNCNSDDNDEYDVASSEKDKNLQAYGQQLPPIMLPFYERRRLSECKEESETDEEIEPEKLITKPTIIITAANGTIHKPDISEISGPVNRFVVTKTKEDDVFKQDNTDNNATAVKQPVSILKKTPSPPSQQKSLVNQLPKKIRYEANGLKDISAEKNSQTIHFPCPSGPRTNINNFFSPQGILNPHLDQRYFDTSLVEIRTSQNQLTTSTKSLDDSNVDKLSDIWIRRTESKEPNSVNDKIKDCSSDSISGSNHKVDVSLVCGYGLSHNLLFFYCILS